MKEDYYKILGVERNADASTIKKQYRKLAQKYHPDKNNGDEEASEKFKKINEAYSVLSNPEERASYDLGGSQFSGTPFDGFGFDDILSNDIFSQMFRGGFDNSQFSKNKTRESALNERKPIVQFNLSLKDIESGGISKTIRIRKNIKCTPCNGSGGEEVKKCSSCNGLGKIFNKYNNKGVTFKNIRACSACSGRGSLVSKICKSCKGAGKISEIKTYNVNIECKKK